MIPYGGTFVRPGVIAWDGTLASGAVPIPQAGYSSCEVIEQAIIGVHGNGTADDAEGAEEGPDADAVRMAQLAGGSSAPGCGCRCRPGQSLSPTGPRSSCP